MNALADTWYVTLRDLRARIRMPVFIFMTLFQPILWLVLFTQIFKSLVAVVVWSGRHQLPPILCPGCGGNVGAVRFSLFRLWHADRHRYGSVGQDDGHSGDPGLHHNGPRHRHRGGGNHSGHSSLYRRRYYGGAFQNRCAWNTARPSHSLAARAGVRCLL